MAYDYVAPTQDMRFVMQEVLRSPRAWRQCSTKAAWADLDDDTAAAVLDEPARFAREVLLALNPVEDQEGCTRHNDRRVSTPSMLAALY